MHYVYAYSILWPILNLKEWASEYFGLEWSVCNVISYGQIWEFITFVYKSLKIMVVSRWLGIQHKKFNSLVNFNLW